MDRKKVAFIKINNYNFSNLYNNSSLIEGSIYFISTETTTAQVDYENINIEIRTGQIWVGNQYGKAVLYTNGIHNGYILDNFLILKDEFNKDIKIDISTLTDELNNKIEFTETSAPSTQDPSDAFATKMFVEVALAKNPEQTATKVTVIDENSTDAQYPSALATKRFVEEAKKLLFIDMWNNACGENGRYNEESGFFELININDITYEEALGIYRVSTANPPKNYSNNMFTGLYASQINYRAFIPPYLYLNGTYNINSLCYYCNELREVIIDPRKENILILNANHSFTDCYKLTDVFNILDCYESRVSFLGAFRRCYALRNISIKNLQTNIDFKDSPVLSNESILYMIKNSNIKEPTEQSFTITLHPDAYARAIADTEISAALAAKPLITLISA